MPALSLRSIPQDVYDGLKAMAAQNRRSMQEQARLLLEREVRLHQPAAMQLSQDHGISVYDATCLALALRHGASLFTADARLAGAARISGALP